MVCSCVLDADGLYLRAVGARVLAVQAHALVKSIVDFLETLVAT